METTLSLQCSQSDGCSSMQTSYHFKAMESCSLAHAMIWVWLHVPNRTPFGWPAEDDVVEWKPVLSLMVQGGSQPLTCSRLCLDSKPSSTTRWLLGSLEGELAAVDANIRAVRLLGAWGTASRDIVCI